MLTHRHTFWYIVHGYVQSNWVIGGAVTQTAKHKILAHSTQTWAPGCLTTQFTYMPNYLAIGLGARKWRCTNRKSWPERNLISVPPRAAPSCGKKTTNAEKVNDSKILVIRYSACNRRIHFWRQTPAFDWQCYPDLAAEGRPACFYLVSPGAARYYTLLPFRDGILVRDQLPVTVRARRAGVRRR